jgi:DNA-binding beta-propeller fold protein YncE
VAVIDPATKTVVDTFIIPVDQCAAPQGMAVGPSNQILLGCNAPSPNGHSNTVIINERSGSVIGRLADFGGNDEVWFNPGDGHYFLAEGQLLEEKLGVVDSTGHRPDKQVHAADNPNATGRRAHSVAADSNKNEVYLPVPAVNNAAAPGYNSTLCGAAAAQGCIAIFSASKNIVQQ